jgi:hypothetical protein
MPTTRDIVSKSVALPWGVDTVGRELQQTRGCQDEMKQAKHTADTL